MRLKLDENLPRRLAGSLTAKGHDVDTVAGEGLVGSDDATVFAAARRAERTLVTLDRGLGLRGLEDSGHSGVIVLRPRSQAAPDVTALVDAAIQRPELNELRDAIAVVDPARIRIRRRDVGSDSEPPPGAPARQPSDG